MILALRPTELVQMDKTRVAEVVARLGPRGADEVISRTMEELAVQLAKVHRATERGKISEVRFSAAKIAEFSAYIGLVSLSIAAGNVFQATGGGTSAALAATAARLDRVGEASLIMALESQDLSM